MYFFVLLEYIFSISEYSIYFHTWTLHSSGWTKYYLMFSHLKVSLPFPIFLNNARQLFSSKKEESYENTTARTHFSSYYLCSLWVLFVLLWGWKESIQFLIGFTVPLLQAMNAFSLSSFGKLFLDLSHHSLSSLSPRVVIVFISPHSRKICFEKRHQIY